MINAILGLIVASLAILGMSIGLILKKSLYSQAVAVFIYQKEINAKSAAK